MEAVFQERRTDDVIASIIRILKKEYLLTPKKRKTRVRKNGSKAKKKPANPYAKTIPRDKYGTGY